MDAVRSPTRVTRGAHPNAKGPRPLSGDDVAGALGQLSRTRTKQRDYRRARGFSALRPAATPATDSKARWFSAWSSSARHDPVGPSFDDLAHQRQNRVIVLGAAGNAIGAGKFHPAVTAFEQSQQRLQCGLVEPVAGFDEGEMIERHRTSKLRQPRLQLKQLVRLEQKLQMPAALMRTIRGAFERGKIETAGMGKDIADAAHAERMKPVHLALRRVGFQHHDRAKRQPERGAEFKLATVVPSVNARLNDDDARDTERRVKLARRLQPGCRRRVIAV